MEQLTREQAIKFAASQAYAKMSYRQVAEFQISQDCLCMPFNVFHEAVKKTLKRSVYMSEFGSKGVVGIKAELFNGAKPPSLEQIINTIPEEKRLVVFVK